MKKRIFTAALATAALSWSVGLLSAQSSGTAAEARAMLDNAVAALKANEPTALAAFNDKTNTKFHDRDLYVFCYDMTDGKFTAHPNPATMGTDVRALKAKDDPLGQKSSTRSTNHQGEVSSRWTITSRSPERPSRFPNNPLLQKLATRAAASAITNSSAKTVARRCDNVRFGSKADMCAAKRHVRFTPSSDRESGHAAMVMSALPRARTCAVQ